ncbi:MAG: class I SAM-dependent methyltransferase [Candidatus Hydrogenedens sp.]|jgi:ubiquinone/menaquinone biosynthesis C-methylase UbiE|nr:class I SAM-dependent methyltransferase [Candidatus Hydrogenedens sp.]
MTEQKDHYKGIIEGNRSTRLARCGYQDRFDPFRLSAQPRIASFYEDLFSEIAADAPYKRILDIGCGTGLYFEWLSPLAERIDALDSSQEMIAVARKFTIARTMNRVHLQSGEAEALPFEDESFDGVIALDMLHHVEDADEVLREVRRVLKKDGFFLLLEPNIRNPLIALAHVLLPEERRALKRNMPRTLRAFLSGHFQEKSWRASCQLITELRGLRGLLVKIWLFIFRNFFSEEWHPRQIWLGTKASDSQKKSARKRKISRKKRRR